MPAPMKGPASARVSVCGALGFAEPFAELVQTLVERGEIEVLAEPAEKQGKGKKWYRLSSQ